MVKDDFEKPCRELDRKVAAEVLGMKIEWDFRQEDYAFLDKMTRQYKPLPYFSIDTEDAYILINWMQTRGYYNQIGSTSGERNNPVWRVSFYKQSGSKVFYQATGETLGHAACKAALNAVAGITGTDRFNVHKPEQVYSTVTKQNLSAPENKTNIIVFPGGKDDK